MNVNWKC